MATDVYTTTLGRGWTHNLDTRLIFPDDPGGAEGVVLFKVHSANQYPFIINPDGTFTATSGVCGALTFENGVYTYVDQAQRTYTFDADGRLMQLDSPNGHALHYLYNNGLLWRVTDDTGQRYLELTYTQGRLTGVQDHTGREVTFDYTGDNLTGATDATGQEWVYRYEDPAHAHLLTEVLDPDGRTVERTEFDGQGRAVRQYNGAGNLLVALAFNEFGTTRVLDGLGNASLHVSNGQKAVVQLTDPNGGQQDRTYDLRFRPSSATDALGNSTLLEWSGDGANLEQVQNARGDNTFLSYDQYNNLTRTVDARDNTTQYEYSNPNFPTFLTKITDALGNSTLYTPTTIADGIPGLLKAEQDPNGNITTYQYNAYGQVIEQVVAAGTPDALTTTYEYDALGRLLVVTRTSAAESRQSLNAYDAGDRLIATIANWTGSNPAAWQNECAIPAPVADENICTRYDYDPAGRPISTTNTLGQTSLTFYDAAGRVVTSALNYDGFTPFAALCNLQSPNLQSPQEYNICSLAGYDEFGRAITSTNSLGLQTVTGYDSLGRVSRTIVNWVDGVFNLLEPDRDLITEYEYDAVGNVLVVTDPLGRKTRTFYDELNRVKGTMENWDGSATLSSCASLPRERDENICTQYEYDEVGNTILVTNSLKQTTRTFYDPLNRVAATVQNWQPGFTSPAQCVLSPDNTDDENVCTLYGYDDAGQQITTTNALNQTMLTVYDAAGRPFLTVSNWDGVTTIDEAADCHFPPAQPDVNLCAVTFYDSLGRRSASQDAMGHLTEYAYDGLGRLITTTRYLDQVPIYTMTSYDALGNRLSSTDAEEHTTTYAYDSLNRLVQTTSAEGITSTQVYNAAGWVITSTDGLSHSTIIGYDRLGRRTLVTDPEGNSTIYQYDALGNQTVMRDAEYVRTGYYYDGLNRLVKVVENEFPSLPVFSHEMNVETRYHYDALGNRLRIQHLILEDPSFVTSTITTYDDLNRPVIVQDALGNETHTGYNALGLRVVMMDGNEAVTEYSYDGLNRLAITGYLADEETVTYIYDAVGNRLAMQDGVGLTTYQYDDLYRLITVTNPFTGVVGYRYDKVGNRTQLIYPDTRTVSYTYDDDNRLIQVEDWEDGITGYEYDAAGRLITTTLPNGVVTVNSYDTANRLTGLSHHDSSNNLLSSYQYELDGLGNRLAVTETMRLPGGVPPAPSGNLLQNPGFEDGLAGWQDWGNLALSSNAYSGDSALRVGDGAGGTAQEMAAQAGLAYLFSGWAILDSGEQAWAVLTFYDVGNSSLGDRSLELDPASSYEPFTIFAVAPPETVRVRAWLWKAAGSGYLFVDELSLMAEPNLLQSPGFEEGLAGWLQWGNVAGSSNAYSGEAALRLGQAEGGVWQNSLALAGSDYLYTGWAQADEGSDAWAGLTFYDAGWEVLGEQTQLLSPTLSYQPFTLQASAPAQTQWVSAWLWQHEGEGYLHGDELSLTLDVAVATLATTVIQYDYDPLYRLTQATYSGILSGTYAYEYDAVGNRTAYTTNITTTQSITYQYNAANQLITSVELGSDTTIYEWDDAGRLITTTVGTNVSRVYTYSQDGDLVAALVDGLLTTFVYDGDGHRLQMSVAGEVVTYTLDYARGFRVLLEEGGVFSETKHYLYGLECIAELVDADEPESEWRYYHQDGNHLVRQTTNIQATVTLAWTYSPEGAVVLGEKGPVTNLGCGDIYDWSTGLIFKNGRYFDPNTGIWITLSGMVIYQAWTPQQDKKRVGRRKRKWLWLCLFLLFVSLLLSGCGSGGSGGDITPVPRGSTPTSCPDMATSTPRPTDDPNAPLSPPILPTQLTPPAPSTPRGNYQSQYDAAYEEEIVALLNGHIVLVNNAWFVPSHSPAKPIKWETAWVGARLEMLGALNAYTGSHGFGSPTKFIDEMVLSQQNPLRLFRFSALGAGGVYASGNGIPRIMVPEYGITAQTLIHELAHRWDDAHGFTLSGNMATQIGNGTVEGPAPTQYGAGSGQEKEDFADSVMAYFIVSGAISGSSLIENPNWSDNDPLNQLGPNRTSASPNTVYVKDRYDYIESLFR